jgi:hypothetical protein
MKNLKSILLTALIGAATLMTTLTSCNPDPCKDVVCGKGTCDAISGLCVCPSGFEGKNCEILSRNKFVGTYNCTDNCTTGSGTYLNTITASSDSIKINFSNMSGLSQALGVATSCYATCNGNNFTIPSQAVVGTTATSIQGSGSISGNIITTTYTVNVVGAPADACSGIWNKQ